MRGCIFRDRASGSKVASDVSRRHGGRIAQRAARVRVAAVLLALSLPWSSGCDERDDARGSADDLSAPSGQASAPAGETRSGDGLPRDEAGRVAPEREAERDPNGRGQNGEGAGEGRDAPRTADDTTVAVDDADGAAPCPPASRIPEDMACVRGGWFERGHADDDQARPVERVWVETFLMDRLETTQDEYKACVRTGRCKRAMPYRGYMHPRMPAIAMRWDDAVAYCAWKDKRLATEAEWERAARGPENTLYPWGDEPATCERAHIKDERGYGCGREVTAEVGSYPAGHWGLFDMAGNVDEWVYDWWAPCYRGCDRECGDACVGRAPRGPCDGADSCRGHFLKIVRGGSWWWPGDHAMSTRRRGVPPSNEANHRFGIRCAADLPESPAHAD